MSTHRRRLVVSVASGNEALLFGMGLSVVVMWGRQDAGEALRGSSSAPYHGPPKADALLQFTKERSVPENSWLQVHIPPENRTLNSMSRI